MVRPGGWVIVGDRSPTKRRGGGVAQQIERLRDPSHWATPTRRAGDGGAGGLEPEERALVPFELDFEEWLARGSGGRHAGS